MTQDSPQEKRRLDYFQMEFRKTVKSLAPKLKKGQTASDSRCEKGCSRDYLVNDKAYRLTL